MTASTTIGSEPFRPRLHYSPARNWMNDPNGLVFFQGTYHMYYQHNPFGEGWGNISWGHAISDDLVSWTEQPLAITQSFDERGRSIEDIFSGSVVVDHRNTSGFGVDGVPPLVAVYTSAFTAYHPEHAGNQAQSLAYSTDGGYTWVKHGANPVVDRSSSDFRDPKVFRYEGDQAQGSHWVMAAVEATERQVVIYRSDNLIDWEHLSTFGPANAVEGAWECPDLFQLPVDGDADRVRWVLVVNLNPGAVGGGSGGQYFVGDFDGRTFTSHSAVVAGDSVGPASEEFQWLDWGRDYYASVSFDNVPGGRRIMAAWMNNWTYAGSVPTSPWRSNMALPREVTLTDTGERIELRQRVVDEVDAYTVAGQTFELYDVGVAEGTHVLAVQGDLFMLDIELEVDDAERVGVVVHGSDGFASDESISVEGAEGTLIGYDATTRRVFVDRSRSGVVTFHPEFPTVSSAPVAVEDGTVSMRVYVDRASVEVFAANGTRTITALVFPDGAARRLAVFSERGTALLRRLTVTPLRSDIGRGSAADR